MSILSFYSYTNQGGRENNEDSIRAWSQDERGVFVLADGLGGHNCGERKRFLTAVFPHLGFPAHSWKNR